MVRETVEALHEIRALARQFAEEQLRPNVERWDHERSLDGGVLTQLAELGFFGMRVPEAHGGMDFDLATYAAVVEELAWGEPAVALIVARAAVTADLVLQHGTDGGKRDWLERLASGEMVGCTAFGESGAESSRVRAEETGDGWTLTGTLPFVVNGGSAALAVVAAEARGETALFLVPATAAGYALTQRHLTMGFRALETVAIRLDGVQLGADALLAARATTALPGASALDQLSLAAIALGIAQAGLDHALAYADQREQFGRTLRNFEGIQAKLADMAVRVHAARALVTDAAATSSTVSTAIAKLFASEAAMWVSTQAVQIFGGYGYMRDYPVEKLMRDAKGCEILGGTGEQLRVLIARELYSE
jgi:alkylation response protein AidB-like acyl-CoA dehydrogenase